MKENKLKNLLNILKLNEAIENMYKLLEELEIKGLKETEDYKNILKLIKDTKQSIKNKMKSVDLLDNDIMDFNNLILKINKYSIDDDISFLDTKKTNKIRRFLEHNKELFLERHYSSQEVRDEYENRIISICGHDYKFEEGISLLREAKHYDEADYIEDLFNDAFNIDYQYELNDENLVYNEICLENSLMLDYLEEAIKNERILSIKKELIHFKYKLIYINKALEDVFINELDNKLYTNLYQNELKKLYKDDPLLFEEWNEYYQKKINTLLSEIMIRNKEKYNNNHDIALDIVLSLRIKTYLLMISEFKSLKSIYDDVNTAKELTKSKLDSNLLDN